MIAKIGELPRNVVNRCPNGRWSFVGKVDAELAYYRKDGQPITAEDVRAISHCGLGMLRNTYGTRTWATEEEALAAAALIS